MTKAKVSIIIPTYNRAQLIRKTIDSILKQTYTNFELIIVSNGSTDETEQVISSYIDPRISYVYQSGSGSPASPRNNGIARASAEYIAFCDDDDLWLATKLENQLEFLETNSEFGVCYTKMKRFNEENEWTNPDEEANTSTESKGLLFKYVIPLSSVIVRRSVLEKIGTFDESKKIAGAEDCELMLRASKITKFYCIPEYLLLYYSGNQRFTNASSANPYIKSLKYLRRLFHVFASIVRKDSFKSHEVILPYLGYTWNVLKFMLCNMKTSMIKG